MSDKREDYISWDEYFMAVAQLAGMRSKDPHTQVGACIVSEDNKILSMGYNGFPRGCSDDEFPWGKTSENPLENKYLYTTHSELNAILNYRGGSSRSQAVCDIVPMQRVLQGDYPGGNQNGDLRLRQVRGQPVHDRIETDDEGVRSHFSEIPPHRAGNYHVPVAEKIIEGARLNEQKVQTRFVCIHEKTRNGRAPWRAISNGLRQTGISASAFSTASTTAATATRRTGTTI